jgi:hypothetical protein
MSLLTDKFAMKVKAEVTKGLQLAADEAIYVEDLVINPTLEMTPRSGGGASLAPNQGDIPGPQIGECTFTAEMKGNGSTGFDTAVATLLQACGLLQTSLVYNNHSTIAAQKTITIDVWQDGKKKGLTGAMGNAIIVGVSGERVLINFSFIGAWVAPTDEAIPAFAPGVESPMRWDTGAFTVGGVASKTANHSLDIGANVVMRMDAGLIAGTNFHAVITRYRPIITLDPEDVLIAVNDLEGNLLSGATAAISMVPQSADVKCTIALALVQLIELTGADRDGLKTNDYTGLCLDSLTPGNDAVIMTTAAV